MAKGSDRGGPVMLAVAVAMLAGGGWMVVKHYRERAADAELRERLRALASDWSAARACLTNGAPSGSEDVETLTLQMTRARDRSMALDSGTEPYPYRCFTPARDVVESLAQLDPPSAPPVAPYDHPFGESSTARPFASERLRSLAALVSDVDADFESLWAAHAGEGSPFPEDVALPEYWDEGVLPPFPASDECLPPAVTLSLGEETPLSATVQVGGEESTITARAAGRLEVDGPAIDDARSIGVGIEEEIARVRACARGSIVHVIVAGRTGATWVRLGDGLAVSATRGFGDAALATAIRGEDGREVHVACGADGVSLVYAGDESTVPWICSGGGTAEPEARCTAGRPQPIGIPAIAVARVEGRTVVLRRPPGSRVAVLDTYEGPDLVGEPRVVPTVDDRANPELGAEEGVFVLRLCGTELHADPETMEWLPAGGGA